MLKCIVGHSRGVRSGDDFTGLKDARIDFVLDTSVLSFQVISNDDEINVLVSGFDSWEGVAMGV